MALTGRSIPILNSPKGYETTFYKAPEKSHERDALPFRATQQFSGVQWRFTWLWGLWLRVREWALGDD